VGLPPTQDFSRFPFLHHPKNESNQVGDDNMASKPLGRTPHMGWCTPLLL
jgi:hypothetical protein